MAFPSAEQDPAAVRTQFPSTILPLIFCSHKYCPSTAGYHTGKYSFDMFTHLRGQMENPTWTDKFLKGRYPPFHVRNPLSSLFPKHVLMMRTFRLDRTSPSGCSTACSTRPCLLVLEHKLRVQVARAYTWRWRRF